MTNDMVSKINSILLGLLVQGMYGPEYFFRVVFANSHEREEPQRGA